LCRSNARRAARIEMRHELVAEEVEVHPLRAAATFRTAEELAVEGACGGEVVNGDGEVKRRQWHGAGVSLLAVAGVGLHAWSRDDSDPPPPATRYAEGYYPMMVEWIRAGTVTGPYGRATIAQPEVTAPRTSAPSSASIYR
jgi:hypothetical protein